jgi:endonuclease YncB( thermonuclease family)
LASLRLTALAAVLVAAACGGDGGEAIEAAGEHGTVAVVVDGDTLQLEDGRRIRLVQVDAPERSECYGRQATAVLIRLAPRGTRVELERDPALDAADDGGRLLRYVLAAGRNLNLLLVEQGAAAPYFFRSERGRLAGELLDAAHAARKERKGLWRCREARLEPGLGAVTGRA